MNKQRKVLITTTYNEMGIIIDTKAEEVTQPLNQDSIETQSSDLISRQAAISAICNACGKIDCDKMDKCEKLQLPPANCSEFPNSSDTISRAKAIDEIKEIYEWHDNVTKERIIEHFKQLPPANNSEIPNSSDTISRQAAIEALKNDMASLDHIIKGMSANDVRLDAYVSQRNQVNYDIYTINNLPPALGTNLAEVGTDCISRQAAIDYCEALMEAERVQQTDDWGYGRERYNQTEVIQQYLEDMPPAQLAPDQNGDLWITVPDIDKVTRIYVQESKSKFCRIFYEER